MVNKNSKLYMIRWKKVSRREIIYVSDDTEKRSWLRNKNDIRTLMLMKFDVN